MKTNKFFAFLLLAVTSASIFTGCSKDDPANPEFKPAISIASPANNSSIATGDSLKLEFTVSSNNSLKRLIVKRKVAGGSDSTFFDKELPNGTNSFSYDTSFRAGPIGTEVYTITVTDKKDFTETKTVTVDVTDGLTSEKSGFFYHISGSLKGAYDLVADVSRGVSEANAEKDMVNTDPNGSPFTGSWTPGIGNSTEFVKAVGYDYANATSRGVKLAYLTGARQTAVVAPVTGDVYIAKLRNGDKYAVILIDAVSTNNNECSCSNTGKLTFKYKKTE